MSWLAVGAIMLVVFGIALGVRLSNDFKQRDALQGVDRGLEEELAMWEAFLLYKYKEVRSTKLFSNRARVLWSAGGKDLCACSDSRESWRSVFCGLTALLELGVVNRNVRFGDEAEFNAKKGMWKHTLLMLLPMGCKDKEAENMLNKFFHHAQLRHWYALCTVPIGIRFPRSKQELKTEHAPLQAPIKGNVARDGTRIYHVPGGQYYSKTKIDTLRGGRWFSTEAEAREAGWRPARR